MGSDDLDTTVIVPGIMDDLHRARGVRLRLRFADRELLVDERRSSITIGRAVGKHDRSRTRARAGLPAHDPLLLRKGLIR